MQRMTDVLSRMLNDPITRAALSAGGEDLLDESESAPQGRSIISEVVDSRDSPVLSSSSEPNLSQASSESSERFVVYRELVFV